MEGIMLHLKNYILFSLAAIMAASELGASEASKLFVAPEELQQRIQKLDLLLPDLIKLICDYLPKKLVVLSCITHPLSNSMFGDVRTLSDSTCLLTNCEGRRGCYFNVNTMTVDGEIMDWEGERSLWEPIIMSPSKILQNGWRDIEIFDVAERQGSYLGIKVPSGQEIHIIRPMTNRKFVYELRNKHRYLHGNKDESLHVYNIRKSCERELLKLDNMQERYDIAYSQSKSLFIIFGNHNRGSLGLAQYDRNTGNISLHIIKPYKEHQSIYARLHILSSGTIALLYNFYDGSHGSYIDIYDPQSKKILTSLPVQHTSRDFTCSSLWNNNRIVIPHSRGFAVYDCDSNRVDKIYEHIEQPAECRRSLSCCGNKIVWNDTGDLFSGAEHRLMIFTEKLNIAKSDCTPRSSSPTLLQENHAQGNGLNDDQTAHTPIPSRAMVNDGHSADRTVNGSRLETVGPQILRRPSQRSLPANSSIQHLQPNLNNFYLQRLLNKAPYLPHALAATSFGLGCWSVWNAYRNIASPSKLCATAGSAFFVGLAALKLYRNRSLGSS